jgi:cystathionine beta-lyase/cystathionine gamma-synthase
VSKIAHARGIEVSVDNTFLSPVLQSPLALGADIVMHSTTKYLNGHSDGLGGALIGSKPEHKERFCWCRRRRAG